MSKKLGIGNNTLLPVSENKIFIGQISNFAVIGRVLCKRKRYLMDIKRIKQVVKMMELTSISTDKISRVALLNRNTELEIIEKEDCVSIDVKFKENGLQTGFGGLTDSKGIGFQRFLNQYKLQKSILIVLICEETGEEFHINGFFNTELRTLKNIK
ncbi:hypothetical protein [Paenibacillus aceris]|uniref:Uncharacterized protein n=1 Tax=Paenibacillus aceris TaxID=869555 RepID=A0ABS4I303_9BACL|nr:hypothetical protein [Paenibacillus aceris]MBP1965183.1 hypothetical protein [Paenibacillus aceris]NHW33164.1 hypothetical protein [Paenibacillus aceris]